MSTYANNVLMIAFGLILTIPCLVYLRHMQRVLHGEPKASRSFIYGLEGSLVLLVLLVLATTGLTICSLCLASMLVRLGILTSVEYLAEKSVLAGIAVLAGIVFIQWKLHQWRFLARLNIPRKTCRNCGYALKGLHLHKDAIRCPECGESEAAREIVARFRLEKKQARMIHRDQGITDDSHRKTLD
jgi:predicted RNA-binding Zn-ribbon protein involved in translation (DUF1610 family)